MCEYMLIVDELPERQEALVHVLSRIAKQQTGLPAVKICPDPAQAIEFSSGHACPIVFAGVDLPGMSGFSMIQRIREQNRQTNFILLASRKEYLIQALVMKLRLSGSILGLPDMETVTEQLNNLWYPLPS